MTAAIQAEKPTGGMPAGHPTWKVAVQMALPTEAGHFVDFPGVAGNYLSAVVGSELDITGDITIEARLRPADWTPTVIRPIVGRWSTGALQFIFWLSNTGRIELWSSTDGTAFVG